MSNGPSRGGDSLADVVEMLLDKGVVINADIAVSIGDTELLGIQLRAALASFETAAEYGLEFPTGTDMRRVEAASGRTPLDDEDVAAEGGEIEAEAEEDEDEGESEEGEESEQVAEERTTDGGSPVAPLHPPPIAEHAPWLKTPPISGESEPDESEESPTRSTRPLRDRGVSSRPERSQRSRSGGERPDSEASESDSDGGDEPTDEEGADDDG